MSNQKTLQVLEGTFLSAGEPQTVLCPYNVTDVGEGDVVNVVNALEEVLCRGTITRVTKKLFSHVTTAECHTVAHLGFSSWGAAYETLRKADPNFSQLSPVSLVEIVPETYIAPGITYSVAPPQDPANESEAEVAPPDLETDEYMDGVVDLLKEEVALNGE